MGRTVPSHTAAPASIRRDARAKRARVTLNKDIPALLQAYPRARKGIEGSFVTANPPFISPSGEERDVSAVSSSIGYEPSTHSSVSIRIRVTDTLEVARDLTTSFSQPTSSSTSKSTITAPVTILNMCSPLRPGGGFLTGATSQEESLCMRTTLYPSLREDFYRLPEVGGIVTRDVLVFREIGEDGEVRDMSKGDRWWVDVVSAGMLRGPEVEASEEGITKYTDRKDRELVEEKMRGVMRMIMARSQPSGQGKGGGKDEGLQTQGVVLGAWGCGAYGNPTGEVARCWSRVLLGDKEGATDALRITKSKMKSHTKGTKDRLSADDLQRERETWRNLQIVFAIKERKMALEFAKCFGSGVEVEMDDEEEGSLEDGEDEEGRSSVSEAQGKIDQLEAQIAGSRSDVQKEMLRGIVRTLRSGMAEGEEDGEDG